MIEKRNVKFLEGATPAKLAFYLCLFNLVLKLVLIPTNRAEYTDGILQITLFSSPNRLYPPLYTFLVTLLGPIFRNPELAGRFISAICGSLIVLPVFFLARSLFNKQAAFFAGLVYTVSPVPLRWSLHAMTDSLFALLFFLAAFEIWRGFCPDSVNPGKRAIWGTVLAVLATLTRYQGVLLFPPLVLMIIFLVRKRWRFLFPLLVQTLWLLPVFWMVFSGFRHPEQFAERAGGDFLSSLANIGNLFESFLSYTPYFMIWPIFFLFLAGLFYLGWSESRKRIFFGLFLYLAVFLLLLQSAFSSFQSRYLLPLGPFAAVFAGWGMETLRKKWEARPLLFTLLFAVTIVYGMGFGLASVFLQREVFRDIKEASLYLKNLPGETVIYSNEAYKDLGAVKMRYWSGRAILPYEGERDLPPGSVLCLSSAYGGARAFTGHRAWLRRKYGVKLLASFECGIVPLLPDVMEEPVSHQNPLALTFRYTPQHFRTEIYRIP